LLTTQNELLTRGEFGKGRSVKYSKEAPIGLRVGGKESSSAGELEKGKGLGLTLGKKGEKRAWRFEKKTLTG